MAETSLKEFALLNDSPNNLDSRENLVEPNKNSSINATVSASEAIQEEEITPEELQDLFEKNTESFRCLAQILLSRSSILNHPLYKFDPPQDPGIEEAFNSNVGLNILLDTVGIQTYKNYCKENEIVPISRIIKYLPKSTLDLRYYGLRLKQIKALSAALVFNRHVKNLFLDENVLESEAIFHISEMLCDNNKIRYLSLRKCFISPKAIAKLSEGIFTTQLVEELDLSYNNIGSKGLAYLAPSIRNNMSIKKLSLRHNGIQGDVGRKLGRVLADNDCLEELDLSWNSLNGLDGLSHICQGLTDKDRLKVLNLSWNGISTKEALIPVIKYMKATTALEHLDLSNNQMQDLLIKMVRAGILGNSSLISINVGSNIITPEMASLLAHVFTADRGNIEDPLKLTHLDMENVYVNKNFIPYWKKLTKQGKFVNIEGILSNYKIKGPDVKQLLFERVRYLSQKPKTQKARKEFGHFLHSIDKTVQEPFKSHKDDPQQQPDIEYMIKADFLLALKKFKMAKVYKDQDLLKEVIKKYASNKDKINATLMRKEYYNYYPDTTIPEVKKKKKKGGKKGGEKGKKRKSAVQKSEEPVIVDEDPSVILGCESSRKEVAIDLKEDGYFRVSIDRKISDTIPVESLKTENEVAATENKEMLTEELDEQSYRGSIKSSHFLDDKENIQTDEVESVGKASTTIGESIGEPKRTKSILKKK